MVEHLYYGLLFPVSVLSALCTDIKTNSTFVCKGDSVKVFESVTSNSLETEITLYKIDENHYETIATWGNQSFKDTYVIHKYQQKVTLENETIVIRDFLQSDEAKYVVLYENLSERKEVELCALVPPSSHCKLKVTPGENFLIAFLDNPDYCGKPLASVCWIEYPNIKCSSHPSLPLRSGDQSGTYIACIKSETLKCMRDTLQWDNCKNYTIPYTRKYGTSSYIPDTFTYTSPKNNDIPQSKTNNDVNDWIDILTLCLVFVIIILLIRKEILRKCVTKKQTSVSGRAEKNGTSHDPVLQPLASSQDVEMLEIENV